MNYFQKSVEEHRKHRGKLSVEPKMPLSNKDELSVAYTPGVAEPCRVIAKDPTQARALVSTKNMVAVVTDGTSVLGLGDIGPLASLPVMEGKSALFKAFAGVDSFPIALGTKDVDEIVKTIKYLEPTFGGINIEDIAAPRCFEVLERLQNELSIPVFHDDQQGTAIVVIAGLLNALKVVGKKAEDVHVVINGAGAAGTGIAKLLRVVGVKSIIVCDSKGIIGKYRTDLNNEKKPFLEYTNLENMQGGLRDAMKGADVFIGVSKARLISADNVRTMAPQSVIFAMANPDPEILPEEAKAGGAAVVATGRSDYPNQLNNVLAFPGVFKGIFAADIKKVTLELQLAAARAIAGMVANPTAEKIIPTPFDEGLADTVASAVSSIE